MEAVASDEPALLTADASRLEEEMFAGAPVETDTKASAHATEVKSLLKAMLAMVEWAVESVEADELEMRRSAVSMRLSVELAGLYTVHWQSGSTFPFT